MSRFVKVPVGYECPLCPDHKDHEFVPSAILKQPVCRGCSHELLNLVTDLERPDDNLLDTVEAITGLNYHEYQILELEDAIEGWQKVVKQEMLRGFQSSGQLGAEIRTDLVRQAEESILEYRALIDHAKGRLLKR